MPKIVTVAGLDRIIEIISQSQDDVGLDELIQLLGSQ